MDAWGLLKQSEIKTQGDDEEKVKRVKQVNTPCSNMNITPVRQHHTDKFLESVLEGEVYFGC